MPTTRRQYTIFVLMTATAEWLAMSREARNAFVETTLGPIFARYADAIEVRMFDAEAFSARCSDIAVFAADDLKQYYFLMEELRDTPLFGRPYFLVNEIIPAIEGGFAQFEREAAARA